MLHHRDFSDALFWQKIPAFAKVERDEFLSPAFQIKNSLSNQTPKATTKLRQRVEELAGKDFSVDVEAGLKRATMSVQLNPYVLSLIDWQNPWQDPVRIQFLPIASTMMPNHPMVIMDSLAEKIHSPTPGLVHRYADRALFLPQTTCPVYCRFCTRSYAVGADTESVQKSKITVSPENWKHAFAYINQTPIVEDVLVSGGDIYQLPHQHLDFIVRELLSIPHVLRIRLATKGLAINPAKLIVDHEWRETVLKLVDLARSVHKQVFVHTHINSPEELTWVTKEAMTHLSAHGIVVRNQAVLLRGVNDSPDRLALLTKRLGALNIQPYYVFQSDLVAGIEDLRTAMHQAMALEKSLRGVTGGYHTPNFIVDLPGGAGKRLVWSSEHYNRETGISVFTAPSTKPDRLFLYYDPLHSLSKEVALEWQKPEGAKRMVEQALKMR